MGPSTPLQSCTSSSRTTIPSAPSRPGPTTSSSSLTGTTGTSSSESSRSTSMLSRTDRRSLTSLETLLTLPTSSASVPPTCLRGLKLDAKQSPNAGTGGRNIDIVTTKAGTQMWKYHAVTSKVNDANQLKVGLVGDFELNPQSLLYK